MSAFWVRLWLKMRFYWKNPFDNGSFDDSILTATLGGWAGPEASFSKEENQAGRGRVTRAVAGIQGASVL